MLASVMLILPDLHIDYLPLKIQEEIQSGVEKEKAIFGTITNKFSYCNEEEILGWKDKIKREIGKDLRLTELFIEMQSKFFVNDMTITDKAIKLFSSEYEKKLKLVSFDDRILLKGDFMYESPFKANSARKQAAISNITPKKSYRRLSFEGANEPKASHPVVVNTIDPSSFTYFGKIFQSKEDIDKMIVNLDKTKIIERVPEQYRQQLEENLNEFQNLVTEKCSIFHLNRVTEKKEQISQLIWLVFERMIDKLNEFWLNIDFLKSTVTFSFEVFMNLYEVNEISVFEIVEILKFDPFFFALYIEDFLNCLPEVIT